MAKPVLRRKESSIEKEICQAARRHGWLVYKWVSPEQAGVPDRLLFRDGRTLAVEIKRPGGHLSRVQRYQHARLRRAGVAVIVLDDLETAQEVLR